MTVKPQGGILSLQKIQGITMKNDLISGSFHNSWRWIIIWTLESKSIYNILKSGAFSVLHSLFICLKYSAITLGGLKTDDEF